MVRQLVPRGRGKKGQDNLDRQNEQYQKPERQRPSVFVRHLDKKHIEEKKCRKKNPGRGRAVQERTAHEPAQPAKEIDGSDGAEQTAAERGAIQQNGKALRHGYSRPSRCFSHRPIKGNTSSLALLPTSRSTWP